jgi:hypothetical protein
MRIVSTRNRSEIELDPLTAYRRGLALDSMLRGACAPIARGVTRGSHAYFNRIDEQRRSRAARILNPA